MLAKIGKLTAVLFILGVLVRGVLAPVQGTIYYVSPQGSDGNSGSADSPWRTLEYALSHLSPGDTLYLRGGVYYENEIKVDLRGTAAAPITIQSYPGERAVIDGGVPYFHETGSAEWELVDGDLQLYRSQRTFSKDFEFVRAWLVDDDVQLVEYETAANLASTNYGPLDGMAPFYMGPGVQLRNDGRVYIRLVYNPNDLRDAAGRPLAPTPRDVNPNHNRLAVFFSSYLFRLDGVRYLHFKDLDLLHADYIMDVRGESHHVALSGCRVKYGNQGILIRENGRDWEIHDCEFTNGVPDYVYWTDVKNRDVEVAEAYPEFQSTAINGPMPGFTIHHNLFRDTFDALTVEDGTRDAVIRDNIFKHVRDDAMNLSRGIGNVEVAHNMLWRVMGGIANLGSNAAPGHVYIHHNVIDNSAYQRGGRPGNYREDNWPRWIIGSPFPSHDDENQASWWKFYNNTVVSRQDPGHPWAPAGPDQVTGNPEKYVVNNIFYMFDDRVIFRDDLVSSGSHYDGNVFYRRSGGRLPLFANFGDENRYDSLHEFRANSGTDWERNGLEVDPDFALCALSDPAFDTAALWARYRPNNRQLFTVGASYAGLEWPGTAEVDYRGALPAIRRSATVFLPLTATHELCQSYP